jgi:hypothetical protein
MLFIDQRLPVVRNYHKNQADKSNISDILGDVHDQSR